MRRHHAEARVSHTDLCCRSRGRADQDFSKVKIKVTKVAGNIYMLQGAGGNIAASVGEDGIVIVDDQYAPLADKIAAALKGIGATDKPVRFVINTHYHGDHTGGNCAVRDGWLDRYCARQRAQAVGNRRQGGHSARRWNWTSQAGPKGGLPIITFDHDVTVHLNGEDIRALHFPGGHTDGDAIVFFPKSQRRPHGRRLCTLRISLHRRECRAAAYRA